jgi:hypothetical protein
MSTRLSTNVPQAVSRQRVSKLEQQPTAIPHNWHEMSLDMLWPRFNDPRVATNAGGDGRGNQTGCARSRPVRARRAANTRTITTLRRPRHPGN